MRITRPNFHLPHPRRAYRLSIAVALGLLSVLPGTIGKQQNVQKVSAASDPAIAAAGDIACDTTDPNYRSGNGTATACHQRSTSNLLVNGGFAAVLDLGDNQYYCGGYQAFMQVYDPTWGRVKSITHPAVGNHEYLTSGGTDCSPTTNAAGYFQYFGSAAGAAGKGYYSFDVGSWHIIALNSNCSNVGGCNSTSAQYSWLKSDLAAHKNLCTLAYWHIPLFSSGGRAGAEYPAIVAVALQL